MEADSTSAPRQPVGGAMHTGRQQPVADHPRRGSLRIYLGAAPGVGKTYAMLNETRRRRERGADAVVGLVETHGRAATFEQIGDLEIIPRRAVEYRSVTLTELDTDAVIARRPDVVAIDEYAHTNAPGSARAKRWEDVERVLDAGIDVITTLNIQHLESLNDVVASITGVTQAETVPDRCVRAADQIELVDMSPEALRRRLVHGNVYPAERTDAALSNFFRVGNLAALRELALLWVADRVEDNLDTYLTEKRITGTWETRERVVVALQGADSDDGLIRRAARLAGRVGGELIGVHIIDAVAPTNRRTQLSMMPARHVELLESLGGHLRTITGSDPLDALMAVARSEHGTQLVIGTASLGAGRLDRRMMLDRLAGLADGVDIHLVPTAPAADRGGLRRELAGPVHRSDDPGTSRRQLWTGGAALLGGLTVLTTALHAAGDRVSLTTALLLYLVLVVGVAMIGGRRVAGPAAVVSGLSANFFLVEPRYTLAVSDAEDLIALGVFIAIGLLVGGLVDRLRTEARDARRHRAEAEALARTAAVLVGDPDPVDGLIEFITDQYRLDRAQLTSTGQDGSPRVLIDTADLRADGLDTGELHINALRTDGQRTNHQHHSEAGQPVDTELPIDVDAYGNRRSLVVTGRPLSSDERRVLVALAQQLVVAVDRIEMQRDAERADELSSIDEARTTLLRAVSHDLRTPLATIKALSSGLLDQSVTWSASDLLEMHASIDEAADRLNRVIGNLLDASRLETGTLAVQVTDVDLPDVVSAAIRGQAQRRVDDRVALPDDLPRVLADRALLERAVANLVENAHRHADTATTITAAVIGDQVHLCVVDRGRGIPSERRESVIAPFQRLDDSGPEGVGLGLSIVDGFIRSMGGHLTLDDTPGGGLTATIELPVADAATGNASPELPPDHDETGPSGTLSAKEA